MAAPAPEAEGLGCCSCRPYTFIAIYIQYCLSTEINANTLGPRKAKEMPVVYGFTKKFAVSPGYGE